MISNKNKFIFFHVPKAAGSSILSSFKTRLQKNVLINDQNEKFKSWMMNNSSTLWPNHIPPSSMRHYLRDEKFQSYFKFAFVRNPYDRLVSLYHYTKQKEVKIYEEKGMELPSFSQNIINSNSFGEWILSGQYGESQFNFLSSPEGKLLVDYVGQTETLQQDVSYICGHLNLPNIVVTTKNKSQHKTYESYLTKDVADHINERYHKDFINFNYEKLHSDANTKLSDDTVKVPEIDILQIKGENKWLELPERNILLNSFKIHPNEYKTDQQSILFKIHNKTAKEIHVTARVKNEKAFQKKISIELEHLNLGFKQKSILLNGNPVNLHLPLNSPYNRIVKISINLLENYDTKNYYCATDLNVRLVD